MTPENEAARDAATGAGIGAALGGLGSILIGDASPAIPGVGPVLALGWLGGVLGAALGGGLISGLTGFLVSQEIPREEASYYAERVLAGAYFVAVRAAEARELEARTALMTAGAEGPIREREA